MLHRIVIETFTGSKTAFVGTPAGVGITAVADIVAFADFRAARRTHLMTDGTDLTTHASSLGITPAASALAAVSMVAVIVILLLRASESQGAHRG